MTEVSKALKVVVDDEFHVHGHGSPTDWGKGAEGVEGRRGGGWGCSSIGPSQVAGDDRGK